MKALKILTEIRFHFIHSFKWLSDVLHSWAIPSLGVKLDATPGRLNQLTISRYRPGVVYGQCSEICGANHSYMPIVVEFISPSDFFS